MAITFRQLRVFETVAQVLSYTAAAHQLHLSQPAVFTQIKQLEQTLGLPLFETIGKKIYLTDAGRELTGRSHLISTELAELTHVFNELKGVERGSLRFATSSTTMPFISKMLSGFFDEHPAISLKIDIATRETQLKHLENNDVEFVIMGRPPEQIYDVQVFMENPLVIVAPVDHPLVKRRSIPLVDVMDSEFIVRESGSTTRTSTERLFQEHALPLKTSIETASNESIKSCVAEGLGLGILSLHMLEPQLLTGKIAVLDVQEFPIIRHWHLVTRKGKKLSPSTRAFMDYVIQQTNGDWPLKNLYKLAGIKYVRG